MSFPRSLPQFLSSSDTCFMHSLGMLERLPYAFMSVVGMRVGEGDSVSQEPCDPAARVGLVCTQTVRARGHAGRGQDLRQTLRCSDDDLMAGG